MNEYAAIICAYFTKWKIKINARKTETIVFKGTNKQHSRGITKNHNNVKITINGQLSPLKNSIKYLGIACSKKPVFITLVNGALEKANAIYQAIKLIL